jgi:hypothetical protein
LALTIGEFSVSDSRETVALVCRNGHTTILFAASVRLGRHLWCAKCGTDLNPEIVQPQAAAEDAPAERSEKVVSRALKSVPEASD